MSVALGAVLLTFGGAVLIAKKFFGKGLSSFGKRDSTASKARIQLEGSRMIGQGRNLHVVRFGDKILLLGATSSNISLIAEIDADNADDEGSFQTVLDNNNEESRGKSIKEQIASRLREISRV